MTIEAFIARIKTEQRTDIIFDFDETLCTLRIDWGSWKQRIEEAIHPYDAAFSSAFSHRALNELTARLGRPFRNHIIEVNRAAERENYHGYSRNEAALEALGKASEIARVHLWTSNCRDTLTPILRELHIDGLFSTKVYFDDVMLIKPDPEGFSRINTTTAPVERFLFVGDSDSDRGACQTLGIEYVDVGELEM
jgi:FMN phosphatase YigB (HAD superfamily)